MNDTEEVKEINLDLNKIREVPQKMYELLLSMFGADNLDYSKIIRHYQLEKGTRLCSDELGVIGFVGYRKHRYNEKAIEFLFWRSVPRGEEDIFEPRIAIEIQCGDCSYSYEHFNAEQRGIFVHFDSSVNVWNRKKVRPYIIVLEKLEEAINELQVL